MVDNHTVATPKEEIARRLRFEFGKNWTHFLATVNEERIALSMRSLQAMLGRMDLPGTSFLDIGSGSGLSSLAARRMGAIVHSFDYDPASVACTLELRRRYAPDDARWTIEAGSVLDMNYLQALGGFDIVYSWGVLHHTGDLWGALKNVQSSVKPGGLLFVAVYNYQHRWTKAMTLLKRTYVRSPTIGRAAILACSGAVLIGKAFVRQCLSWLHVIPPSTSAAEARGMRRWYDLVDWVGGYPFEAARPDEIVAFYDRAGFKLVRSVTCGGGHGCNEFVFQKAVSSLDRQ